MHMVLRRYQAQSLSVDEIVRQVEEGFVPLLREAPGLVDYYVLESGPNEIVTVSLFKEQAAAEDSNRLAAEFLRQRPALAQAIAGPPQILAGAVRIHTSGDDIK